MNANPPDESTPVGESGGGECPGEPHHCRGGSSAGLLGRPAAPSGPMIGRAGVAAMRRQ